MTGNETGRYVYLMKFYNSPDDPEPFEILEEPVGGLSDELPDLAWRQAGAYAAANGYERVDVQFFQRCPSDQHGAAYRLSYASYRDIAP